ncbi:inner membrane protein [Halorubrum vacuolatum]|uniref:Inner membrane protein n=2 Tax=Halorubrum vacuolatum TaxID=63740 RepID=A0A238WTM9_HALVU|nr:inner membrane protein [Halorubrum vacuolatum]
MLLILYAPVLVVLLWMELYVFALLGLVLGMGLVMLPDKDQGIPLLPHRGFTHTIWFASLVGLGMALVGMILAPILIWIGVDVQIVVLFLGFVGVFSIVAHLFADAITPAGIRPYQPLSQRRHSGRISANSFLGNWVLWLLGIGAILFALYFVFV